MALSYKARRRWALVVLLLGLPIYIITALVVVSFFELNGKSAVLQLLVYVGLGVIWAIPLKSLFKGVGQADPDADPE